MNLISGPTPDDPKTSPPHPDPSPSTTPDAAEAEIHSRPGDDPGEFPADADDREPVPAGPPEGCIGKDEFRERFMNAGDLLGGAMQMRFGLVDRLSAFDFRADPLSPQVADSIYDLCVDRPWMRWAIDADLSKFGAAGICALWAMNRVNALRSELPRAIAHRDALRAAAARPSTPDNATGEPA